LNRNINTATGQHANTPPATNPAAAPNRRRTVAYNTATHPTPSTACGTNTDHAFTPKTRAETSITHNDPGGLSTVMKPEESNDPKNIAFHDDEPACTAAE
jgi:hypothetical protein